MIKRYCAGNLIDGSEDFYWDTRFTSIEECIEWAINHNCSYVYDEIEDKFMPIE